MRRFVLGWEKLGLGQRLDSRIVTYADDTHLQGSGRGVRLPGVHVRTDVFTENRLGTPGATAIEEKHPAHDRDDP